MEQGDPIKGESAMSDETTTHECPICGDVHLPPVVDEKDDEADAPPA